jgi:myo-inositol 2-dehydrogenase / D-chiro-inositol 1-dehydrogenase
MLPSSSSTFNLGLIGAGRIGMVHCTAASALSNVRITHVADYFLKAAEAAAAKFNIPHASQDWRPIMECPDVHAVVVCSPSDTHCEIIIAAARAGKHVFCEKPIDYNLARIDEALAAVQEAGVKLQLGFQRRFDADFKRVRQAVQDGDVGTPYSISIVSRDPGLPPIGYLKASGTCLFCLTRPD